MIRLCRTKLKSNELIKVTNNDTKETWLAINYNQVREITGKHPNLFDSRFFKRDWTLEIIDGSNVKWSEIYKPW